MKFARTHALLLAGLATIGISACGGSSDSGQPAPGTPQNPLQAQVSQPPVSANGTTGKAITSRNNEAAQAPAGAAPQHAKPTHSGRTVAGSASSGENSQPAYQTLVDRQTSHPQSRFSACNLVTINQAQSIVGAPMQAPVEAPQGPTCIYRTQTGKRMIAVAVQTLNFKELQPLIRKPQRVSVSNRSGFCGTYGQSMLYLPLAGGRVLSISAPCDLAKGFALRALPHL